MKVDDGFQGWEVWVETEDGVRLNEYQCDDVSYIPNKIICWLETPQDLNKHFKVTVVRPGRAAHEGVRFSLVCDGRKSGTKPFRPGLQIMKQSLDTMITEGEDGRLYESRLRFGRLETTDNEEKALKDMTALSSLGEIRVKLERGHWIPTPRGNRNVNRFAVPSSIGAIHERAKKGAMDMTVVGGDRRLANTRFGKNAATMFRRFDETEDYFVIFKYASRGLLLARDIIPRPDTPDDPDEKFFLDDRPASPAKENDDNGDEIEEVEAHTIKLRMKREAVTPIKSGHRKKPIFVPDEIIDLRSP